MRLRKQWGLLQKATRAAQLWCAAVPVDGYPIRSLANCQVTCGALFVFNRQLLCNFKSLCLEQPALIPKEFGFRALGKGKESRKGVVSSSPWLAGIASPQREVRGRMITGQYLGSSSSASDLCTS